MSDHSHLLEDPRNADAIAAFVGTRPGDKVVGLHDEVMVRNEIIERRTDLSDVTFPFSSESYIVRTMSEPYATVEVILVTRTGRPYAKRYAMTLAQFLDLVHERPAVAPKMAS